MAIRFKMNIRAKLLAYVLATSILVLGFIGAFIQYRTYRIALNDAQAFALSSAENAANIVKSELEFDLGFTRSLAHSFYGYHKLDDTTRDSIYFDVIRNQIEQNPRYATIWYNLEYWAIDPTYNKNFGRRSISTFMKNGYSQIQIDQRNMTGDIVGSDYHKAKVNNSELLSNPYFYKYDGVNEVLMTSVSAPIRHNGYFVGLAGVDVTLDKFQETIRGIRPYNNSQAFLLSNNSTLVAHTNELNLGKIFQEVYPEIAMEHRVSEKVQMGISYSFSWDFDGKEHLVTIAPVDVGNFNTPWSVGIIIPMDEIMVEAHKSTTYGLLVAALGLFILVLVLYYVSKIITRPIIQTTAVLNDLALGDIDRNKELRINTGDELEDMAQSVNRLIEGLNLTESFAREIGKGNLDAEFKILSNKDLLGTALIDMQNSLKQAKQAEEERKLDEKKQNWATQGMAKFGDILRQNNDNLNELSFNTIRNLVDYTESNQGGVFILNDNDNENPFLEMTACYAFDRRKFMEKSVEMGEGLVGRCFREGKTIYMTDVPADYITISSGLGQERPRCLIIVPLKYNDMVLGVIEMATFRVYEKHQVEFIEKLAESIAATIASVRINIRTTELLAKSQQQAEEMQAQEEEMRQNMEELQATQEEMERKRAEQEKMQEDFQKEIMLLNALMNNIPDYIYFKDESSHFMRISKSMVKLFNANSPEDLVGKSDFDFHTKENAEKFFMEEQEIMRSIKPIVDKVVQEKFDDGREQWVSTTKMPLFNTTGEVVGTWGISKIITDLKQAEIKAQELASEADKLKGMINAHEGEYQAIVKALDSTTFVTEYTIDGTIIRINEPLQTIMGKPSEEVAGKHHADFFRTKADDDASYHDFWDDLRRGIVRQRVFKGSVGGSRLVLNETYSPVKDSEGSVEKIIAIAVRG
jgi:PAS domain S-box-containing protein